MVVRRALVVILALMSLGCGTGVGGNSSEQSETAVAPPTTAAPETTAAAATTSTSTTTSAPTTTSVPAIVTDILVAGDSMALTLFPPAQAALETESTEVRVQWVIGVLILDEMAKWERIFTVDRPDVVVVHFMAWESAALQQGTVIDTSEPGWAAAYRADWIEPWIGLASSSGSRVVWVTPPLSADAARSAEHQELGAVWVDAIEQHNAALPADDTRRINIIDSVAFSAGPDGGFVAIDRTVDPPERLFNADGLHWCPAGAARLNDELIDTLISLGIATANTHTPDWRTSPWAVDAESVRESDPNFGTGFAYPPGECPDPVDD